MRLNNNNLIGNDIKLKLPDKYDGTRDVTTIENFFCAVDKLQYIKGWDERKTFLIASALLSGRAETWVNHLEKLNDGSAPTTWTHLKEILTSKFKPTNGEDVARDLLWVTTQKTTIQAYVDAFMDCSILITDTTDADLCDRFVRGLKNEWLITEIRRIPIAQRTLEIAIQTALAFESAKKPNLARAAASSFVRPTRASHADTYVDDPMELDAIDRRGGSGSGSYGRYRGNNNYGSGNNSSFSRQGNKSFRAARSGLKCFECQETGHFARDCPRRTAVIVEQVIAAMSKLNNKKKFKGRGSLNAIDDTTSDCNDSDNKDSHSSYLPVVVPNDNTLFDNNEATIVVDVEEEEVVTLPVSATEEVFSDIITANSDDIKGNVLDKQLTPYSSDYVLDCSWDDEDNYSSKPNVELIPVIVDSDVLTSKDNDLLVDRIHRDLTYFSELNTSSVLSNLPLYSGLVFSAVDNAQIQVNILVDNGATENYIAPRISRMIHGDVTQVAGREVETAGGEVSPIEESINFDLDLQGHFSSVDAFVFDTKFDIILGRAFIKMHEPEATWRTDAWTFRCCLDGIHRKKLTILPMNTESVAKHKKINNCSQPQLNYLISHKQAQSMLNEEGTEGCLLFLMDDDVSKGSTTIGKHVKNWVDKLASEFPNVFRDTLPGLPPVRHEVAHVVNIPDGTKPINRPPFRMSPAELDELQKQLKELASLGLIRPSSSPWGAPVLFVKKKDGSMRMCIDYRALNKVTIRNTTPLPRIDECLDRLQGASYFTSLDLRSGYHQIRVQESDIPKTAFNTRYGKWEFLVVPFGLCNSPSSFQSWMNGILSDCLDKFALVYLDDVLIFSKTLDDHIKHVREVLQRFDKQKLVVNLKKCEFAKRELEFLGFRISADGILPSVSKTKAIQEWKRPANVQEVRQFLGLAQHYRRFCPGFSSVAAPLTELTHGSGAKKRAIIWNKDAEKSFKAIKDMLTSPPLLRLPNMLAEYRIETDSSDFGVGMVLLQQDVNTSEWVPIAYESKKLSVAEQKLPAQERELIAIIHALNTWRCFVDGCPGGYTVYSDHKPLIYFQSQLKPTPRLVRWMNTYEMYNPRVEYKAGKDNEVADALSRRPNLFDGDDVPALEPDYLYATWDRLPHDIRVNWPLFYVNNRHHLVKSSEIQKKLEKEEDNFVVQNDVVYRKVQLPDNKEILAKFIPFEERADLVFKYHEGFGHAGLKTMFKMFVPRFWWPGFRKDITDWLKTCSQCQLNSVRTGSHQDVMHPLSIPKAFERWHLDFVGRLPVTASGNKWLLIAVDSLTNWPIARAVPVASEEAVADFLYEEIVMKFGCPAEIITDRGSNFTSGLVKAYTTRIGTNHKLTSAFHPRTNSKVERFNGVIKQMLRKYCNGAINRWDDFLNAALWASRIRVHSTTGFSPFYLTYGREPRLPGDVLQPYISRDALNDARTVADITSRELQLLGQHRAAAEFRLRAMGERDKAIWDAKIKPLGFEIGDLVMLTHEGKFSLEPRFKGPFVVTQVFPDYGTYQLETVAGEPLKSLVHVDRLKAAKGDKPEVPWYDPTSSRREVRENNRDLVAQQEFDNNTTDNSAVGVVSNSSATNRNIDFPEPDSVDPIDTTVTADKMVVPPVITSNKAGIPFVSNSPQVVNEDLMMDNTDNTSNDEEHEALKFVENLAHGYDNEETDNQASHDIELEDLSESDDMVEEVADEEIKEVVEENDEIESVAEENKEEMIDVEIQDVEKDDHEVEDIAAGSSSSNFFSPLPPSIESTPMVIADDPPQVKKPFKFVLPPIPTTASSSRNVQRRTLISEGGNVGIDNVLEPENDLEDNIVNWNANKRIVFKPVVPERRIKKQRLFNLSFLLNRFRK